MRRSLPHCHRAPFTGPRLRAVYSCCQRSHAMGNAGIPAGEADRGRTCVVSVDLSMPCRSSAALPSMLPLHQMPAFSALEVSRGRATHPLTHRITRRGSPSCRSCYRSVFRPAGYGWVRPSFYPVFPGRQRLFFENCLLTKTPERALYRVSSCGGLIPVSVPRSPRQGAVYWRGGGIEPPIVGRFQTRLVTSPISAGTFTSSQQRAHRYRSATHTPTPMFEG